MMNTTLNPVIESTSDCPSHRSEHRQVTIAWRRRAAEVDEQMAPLILLLWKLGIAVSGCCQEIDPGRAWVQFPRFQDAVRFLNLVAEYPADADLHEVRGQLVVGDVPYTDTLYSRIEGLDRAEDWEYHVHWYNRAVLEEDDEEDENEVRCTGPTNCDFKVCIQFPRTDLPLLLEQLSGKIECVDTSAASRRRAK
jgi:hypothetical protein